MEDNKRKNDRIKNQVMNKGTPERGLYYNLKHSSNFDVLVSLRIGDKQIQRKKKDISFITEARKIRDKFIVELEGMKAEANRGDMFWSKALEIYFKHLEDLKDTNEMSESTYITRITTLTAHTKNWATMKLSDFHQTFIRQFIFENLKDKTPETKKNILKFIRQVFQHQISIGNIILRFNPASGIRAGKTKTIKPETISKIDMEKIIQHTHEQKSEWASVYYLAYQLGCRSGELYALKWSDVNWSEKNITVGKSYCWKSEKEKMPKNDKFRMLPLNTDCCDYLKNLKSNSVNENIFILPRIPAWKQGRAAELLASFQGRLGIDKTNFHSIRSTFITQLLLNDVAPVKVMELAGHADFKTTAIYLRSVAKELKGTTDSISLKIDTTNLISLKKPA